jgi:hypothetical protein
MLQNSGAKVQLFLKQKARAKKKLQKSCKAIKDL